MGDQQTPRRGPAIEPRSGLEHDEIRAQLARILASPEFHATDRMRDFLRFVVEEKLAGRSHRLKGYTIAMEVFGRGEDFDATHDPIVRIQAGRLRRALERYYLVGGVRDPILIDIPKGRYIPRFAVPKVALRRPNAAPSLNAAARQVQPHGPSVVVLPFENLTDDADQRVLTAGLTEELVTELTRFQDLVVVPCQVARQPPGFPADPVEMAHAVGARFVLQGTVRRDATSVKVASHLTDVTDGQQIWAEAFTHPLEASRLIATQEHIAHSVVTAVAGEFGIIARRLSAESRKKRPSDLRTYEAMLRYYTHQVSPSPESAVGCFSALQSASEREPEYGPVWSALATLHCQMYTFDAPGFDDALATGLEYARKGVFLEPGSQLARLILAYASYLADDTDGFRDESETALALNPNSPYTVGAIGYMHVMQGEIDRGQTLLDSAIAVCPCHPRWFHAGYVLPRILERNYDEALVTTRKHLPFIDFWDDVVQAALLGKLGRIDEARTHLDAARARKPDVAGRTRELMRRSLKIDDLIDDVLDGLRRAGISE